LSAISWTSTPRFLASISDVQRSDVIHHPHYRHKVLRYSHCPHF
jgi:hypothetical protein